MNIRILGCSGGIGPNLRTTSILIDNDILIDCGTGVGDLTMEELSAIRHIFISHGHLDHVGFIPFLVDSAFDALVNNPITIHLKAETHEMLREHIFNWKIWPDFAKLPDASKPVLKYNEVALGQKIILDGRIIEPVPVTHTQPAFGYRIQSPDGGTFAYSGDTKTTNQFWDFLNTFSGLDMLFIECAYLDNEEKLSQIAGHYRPSSLAEDLNKLNHHPELYIMHQKPGEEEQVMHQLTKLLDNREPKLLQRGQVFEI